MRRWLAVAFLCVGIPLELHAQSAYENHLVGDRSLGLAGAFVGLADDASAAFHNPGGLATLPGNTFSGSLWAVALESRAVEGGFRTDYGSRDLRDSIMRRLPFFLAGTLKLGARDGAGIKPHALGLVITQPFREEFRFAVQQDGTDAAGFPTAGRLQMQHAQTATWFGLSYAYRLSPKLSLGVTSFITHQTMRHTESELQGVEATLDSTATQFARARSLDIAANSQHLLWRIGALYDHSERWRFGLMLQPPGARLRGAGRVSQMRSQVDSNGSSVLLGEASGLDADAPRPWEVRVGGTWYNKESLWTLDLSMLGPVPDADTFVEQIKEVTGHDVRLPSNLEQLITLRGALGFEHHFHKDVPVRGGIHYQRQGTSSASRESMTFVPATQNVVGVAFSVGYRGNGYDLSVGSSLTLSSGTGLALNRSDAVDEAMFSATSMRARTLFIFISGGARAAVRVARSVFSPND